MEKSFIHALALLSIAGNFAHAESDNNTVPMYQVGKDGKYCLSITRDEKGCVSGSNGGNTINVMDFIKGKKVVFYNLSDAPHDMRFTGANAQDLPAQAPNGELVVKKMDVEDMSKQKVTCSYHGDQLAVGYRVPSGQNIAQVGDGHREPGSPEKGPGPSSVSLGDNSPAQKTVRTGLADVSDQVLAKGKPEDVQRLLASRPELAGNLQNVRPLLAAELGVGGAAGKGIMAVNAQGSQLDTGFGKEFNPNGLVPTGLGGVPRGKEIASANGGEGGAAGRAITAGPGNGGADGEETDDFGADGSAGGRGKNLVAGSFRDQIGPDGLVRKKRSKATDVTGGAAGQGRALASLDGQDRTRLKVFKKNQNDVGDPNSWHKWLILLLLVIAAVAARMVLFATRTKREEEDRARGLSKG